MAEFTPNFNLKKPNEYEFYNIDDFNENMDIIDQALKNAGQNEQLQIDVTEIKTDIGSPEDISTGPTIFGKLADIKEMLTNKFSEVVSKITRIDSKIGTSLDSGTDTVFGLLSGLNSKGAVKSVQRGVLSTSASINNPSSKTITINSVDINKSVVLVTACSQHNEAHKSANAQLLDEVSLIIYPTTDSNRTYGYDNINWQVIEFY